MNHLRRILAGLSYLSIVPKLLAAALLCFGLVLLFRPTWPAGELVMDSPNPVSAPFSGQPVCAYHVCVEHTSGSTCLGNRVWADPTEFTAPDGSIGTAEFRWNAPEPKFDVVRGESRTAIGEMLVDTDSERVKRRCANAACTWTEMIIHCGSKFSARYSEDSGAISVEHRYWGHGVATAGAIVGGVLVLLMMSSFLSAFSRFRRQED